MAIILFKKGNTTKVNGIPCQIQVCNEFSYLHLLDEGWYYTPEEMLEGEKAEKEEPSQEEPTEVELAEVETELTDDEIRAVAKKANIGNWHNKKIDRLLEELKELEDAE